jgi:CheY-like chemotaxis protein
MRRVLLVDDNEMFLDSATDVLEGEGYEVVSASSGEEALDFVQVHRFGVVVMDIKMAGLNGIETFVQMKRHCADLKVIVLTAHLVEDLIRRAEAEGAVAVLKKPVKTAMLLAKIEEACAGPGHTEQ